MEPRLSPTHSNQINSSTYVFGSDS
uniref:Uncharacterized protein n=1 Tax=Anguilla anguilla TaxID=7936 RepID=A0A0E9V9W2_ANGAN